MTCTRQLLAAVAVAVAVSAAPAPAARAEATAPAADPPVPAGEGTVNLNTATVDELARLPGVGPSKAAAVCAFRQRHGPFRRLEDLDRVKGFGRKLIGRIRRHVALSGPTTFIGKPRSKKDAARPSVALE
jgi:competence protein ComEA